MNFKDNFLIFNGHDIGISEIEMDKSVLLVSDKSKKYCLSICIYYNWKDINAIKIGEQREIDFNEYCFSENNESALLWPIKCYVKKNDITRLEFSVIYNNLNNDIVYMNKRGHFDSDVISLKCKVNIDYKDANKGSIIYKFE